MTLWARKRAPRAPHGPPFPTALSPEAEAALSLGDFFSIPPTLSLPLPFLVHFEIAAVHVYSHSRLPLLTAPRSTPSPPSAAAESPSEPTPSPLPAHPPSLSLSFSRALPRCPSPFVAVAASHVFPSHIQHRHTPPSPRPLSLNSVLQCPVVAADQTHELTKLICP